MTTQGPVLASVLLFAIRVLADEPRLIALDGALGVGVPATIERFLGEDAIIPAIFLRVADAAPGITADVYLDGGQIAAPMARGVMFQADAKASHPSLIEGKFVLPRPDTDKSVVQAVRIQRKPDGNNAAAASLASFRLRWVSQTECRTRLALALASQATGQAKRLVLAGALPGLRELLREWHIPYEDAGREMPVRLASGTLTVGEELAEGFVLPELGDSASLLLVRLRPVAATEIWRKDANATRLTQVDLPRSLDWRRSPLLVRLLTDHLLALAP